MGELGIINRLELFSSNEPKWTYKSIVYLIVIFLSSVAFGQKTFQAKILQPKPNSEINKGETIIVEVTLLPFPPISKRVFMTAVFQLDQEVIDRLPLYDDGDPDHYDRVANDNIFTNGYVPRRTGTLTMRVRVFWDDDNEIWSEPINIIVKEAVQETQQKPLPAVSPTLPSKSLQSLGAILTLLGLAMVGISVFSLRRTIQPQDGLGIELRFIGKREVLLSGPRGSGDIVIPNERFGELKLAKLKWDVLTGLTVKGLQAKVWVEETKGERLRDGINHVKVSQTIKGVPVAGEVIINVNNFIDENRFGIATIVLGLLLFFIGFILWIV